MYDFQLNCRLRQAAGENVEESSYTYLRTNFHKQSIQVIVCCRKIYTFRVLPSQKHTSA